MKAIQELKDQHGSLKEDYARFVREDGAASRLRLENSMNHLKSSFEELRKDLLQQIRALKANKAV